MTPPIAAGLKKAGLATAQKHLFLCLGPDCCNPEEGEAVWAHLKQTVVDLDLKVMRTKAGCFRICHGGPWLVIYPDGVWYGNVTVERLTRILTEHVRDGKPVTDWIVTRNALSCGDNPARP